MHALSLYSLPTNAYAALLEGASSSNIQKEKNVDILQGHCYTTLISEGSSDTWYIATCEGKNDNGTYKMDHLMIVGDRSNLKWKHPPKCDLLNLDKDSILECKIEGEWNASNEGSITFSLIYYNQIDFLVEQIFLQKVKKLFFLYI